MIPALRAEFNRKYSPDKYRQFLDALDKACGMHVGFRVSETPYSLAWSRKMSSLSCS